MTTDKTSIITTPTITNAAVHTSHQAAEFFVSMAGHTNGSPNPYYGNVNYNQYKTATWPVPQSVTPTAIRVGSTGVTRFLVRPPALTGQDVPSKIVLRLIPYVSAIYEYQYYNYYYHTYYTYQYTTQIYPVGYGSSSQYADLVMYDPATQTGYTGGVVELPIKNPIVIPYDNVQYISAVLYIQGYLMGLDNDYYTPSYVPNSNYFYNSHFGWTFKDFSLALEF